MFDFSPVQIILVLAIALLVLGPKRLPAMARSLGDGVRGTRRARRVRRDGRGGR
jgi:TatA/E family protein of Tat protein translocase